MEGASAVAGIISLAALTVHGTVKLYAIIGELKDVPTRFHRELDWLAQLRETFFSIERTGHEMSHLNIGVNTGLLYQILSECKSLVQTLTEKVEAQIGKIERQGRFKHPAAVLGTLLKSDDFQRIKDSIDLRMKDLRLCHQEVSSQLLVEQFHLTRHTYHDIKQILKIVAGNHVNQLENSIDVKETYPSVNMASFIKPPKSFEDDPLPPDYGYASSLNKACDVANDTVVSFLLERDHLIDASLGRYRTTDLSQLMSSTSIPIQNQPKCLSTMRLLLDAGSCLDCSYISLIKSWMKCPYVLEEGFAIYHAYAERSDAMTLVQFMRGGSLLKPFRDALYTHSGPIEVRNWTTQIVDAALRFQLNFGTDLKNGVLYLDGPLKYSIWFDACCSSTSPSDMSLRLKDQWFDELESNLKYAHFKAWFDVLILYDAKLAVNQKTLPESDVDKYLEPTLHALLGGHLSPWLCALHDAGIDVSAVVLQTSTLATGEEAAYILECIRRRVSQYMKPFPRKYLLPAYCERIHTVDDLKEVIIAAFKQNGYDMTEKPRGPISKEASPMWKIMATVAILALI